MCRYIAYLGEPLVLSDILYNPSNGLIHQASNAVESRTRINADGFGIGWYNPEVSREPAVFKDISPAWNNANLRSLAGAVASTCIMAHVRAAQRLDPISRANCHPFQSDGLLWMHNGDIPSRARLHRRVVNLASDELVARISGNTDTELAFVLFLTLLGEARFRQCTADDLADAMTRMTEQIVAWWREDTDDRPLVMNFCVANGESLVALRYALHAPEVPTLHYCHGSSFTCEDGVCHIHSDGEKRCAILASEVLSEGQQWETIDNGTMVVVHDPGSVELRRLTRAT